MGIKRLPAHGDQSGIDQGKSTSFEIQPNGRGR
jgi:hypothetical protein